MLTLQKILKDQGATLVDKEHSYKKLPDIEESLKLLKNHIIGTKNIGILGDFDCDGITSTSSLVVGLKEMFPSKTFYYKVPERNEGHGLNKKNIDYMSKNNVSLILTCDNASNDSEMVTYGKKLGIDFIITDHHQVTVPLDKLNYLLVNPERSDSKYPYSHLCGCSVVYKLLQAVNDSNFTEKKLSKKTIDFIKVLTSIATIVDMVKFDDENILMVTEFKKLLESNNLRDISPFLELLIDKTNYSPYNSSYYGFTLGPLFNVAGRLLRANFMIKSLVEHKSIENLHEITEYFLNLNYYRRDLTSSWISYVKKTQGVIKRKFIRLVKNNELPTGLRRLVGNHYLDNKVCFCGGQGKGDQENIVHCSVSNSYNIDLVSFLRDKPYTYEVGGHIGAFGYSYYLDQEEDFLEDLDNYLKEQTELLKKKEEGLSDNQKTVDKVKKLFDYELKKEDITIRLFKEISSFVWGMGLEEPKFLIKGRVKNSQLMKGKHLKVILEVETNMGYQDISCIKWSCKEIKNYITGENISVIGTLSLNSWMGRESLQLMIS